MIFKIILKQEFLVNLLLSRPSRLLEINLIAFKTFFLKLIICFYVIFQNKIIDSKQKYSLTDKIIN